MKQKLEDILNVSRVNELLEGFNKTTGFVTAILDLDGAVIFQSGWRRICTEFHRVHPKTAQRCIYSDTILANKMKEGAPYHAYTCMNGLVDVAVPLRIHGEHVGNLFTGQFFLEEPDIETFREQAREFGFDEEQYLAALGQVPVVSEDRVKASMDFMLQMTEIISELAVEKREQAELNDRLTNREKELQEANRELEASNGQLRATEQELHRTNEQLKASEERFTLAMKASNDGLFDWNLKTNEIYFSPGWKKILGFQNNELPNDFSVWENRTDPQDVERSWQLQKKLISGEMERFVTEFRMQHKDGRWVDILVRAEAVFDEDGKAVRIVGTHTDISERKQAEQELRASEEKYYELIENMTNAVAVFEAVDDGADFVFKDINRSGEVIDNVHRTDIVGRKVTDVFPGVKDFGLFEVFQDVWHSGTARNHPVSMYRDNRIAGWRNNFVYKLSSGEVVSVYEDITQRKQAEEALQKKQRLLNDAEQLARMGSWEWDVDNDRVYWSEGLFTIFKLSPRDGAPGWQQQEALYDRDSYAELSRAVEECVQYGTPYTVTVQVICSDGEQRTCVSRARGEKDANGRITRLWGQLQDITERVKAEKALQESDWKFRALFENGPIGVAYHAMVNNDAGEPVDYYFLDANESYRELTGVDPRGKLATEAFPGIENDPFDWIGTFGTVARTGKSLHFEQYLEPNRRWYSVVAYQYRPDHFVATFFEITKRKEAEQKLEQLHTRYLLATDAAQIGVWELDPVHNKLTWDDIMFRLYGIDRDGFSGAWEAWKNCIHPDDRTGVDEAVQQALSGEKEFRTEFRVLWPNKEVRTLKAFAAVERDRAGIAIRMIGINYDITEHRRMEEAVVAEKERLAVTLRSISDGVITTDTAGRILLMNRVAENLTGWKLHEAQGKDLPSVFNKTDGTQGAAQDNPVEKVIATGTIVDGEQHAVLIARDGTNRIITDSAAPMKDRQSTTVGVVLIFRDMTEKQRLWEAAQKTQKLESLGYLAGGIAH
ncbi:MAG: PocR ligand-binding domain-containing protein, partial [Fibrobacterota bacterium]